SLSSRGNEKSIENLLTGPVHRKERFGGEGREDIEHIDRVDFIINNHRASRFCVERSCERAESAQGYLLNTGKNFIAPVQHRAERLMPRRGRATTSRQQPQTIAK